MTAMRAAAGFLCVALGATLSACGSTEPGAETATIVGYWFGCEFGADDACTILDDDGHHFSAEGMLYYVEESVQASESGCGGSPCFRADAPAVTVDAEHVGTYSYTGTSLTVTAGACTETTTFPVTGPNTTYTGTCLEGFEDAQDGVVDRYAGSVTMN